MKAELWNTVHYLKFRWSKTYKTKSSWSNGKQLTQYFTNFHNPFWVYICQNCSL